MSFGCAGLRVLTITAKRALSKRCLLLQLDPRKQVPEAFPYNEGGKFEDMNRSLSANKPPNKIYLLTSGI